MFSVGEWPWDLLVCVLDVLENNFNELNEALFQLVERSCEIYFCYLGIQKGYYYQVA
jgi:hypothetical protein